MIWLLFVSLCVSRVSPWCGFKACSNSCPAVVDITKSLKEQPQQGMDCQPVSLNSALEKKVNTNTKQINELASSIETLKVQLKKMRNGLEGKVADYIPDKIQDCMDLYHTGKREAGVYNIGGFNVYCSDGWTYLMNRVTGKQTFNRTFGEYVKGFGDLEGDHWLGLDHMHTLTQRKDYRLKAELFVDTQYNDDKVYHVEYDLFEVGDSSSKYQLSVGNEKTNFGSTRLFLKYSNNMPFSAIDRDNDARHNSCTDYVIVGGGGWWYRSCGQPLTAYWDTPLCSQSNKVKVWFDLHSNTCLRAVRMALRPA